MRTGLGSKIIRQMAAAAAGKGGVRRLSAGRSGGRGKTRPAQSFNRATQGSEVAPQPNQSTYAGNVIVTVYALVCFDYVYGGTVQADVIKKIKGFGEGLKNLVVRKEVSRPPLPAEMNTAEFEQTRNWEAEFEENRKWGRPFKA